MTVALQDTNVARWVSLLGPTRQLAELLSMTEFVPAAMRGKPDTIAAAILYGDELGLDPMVSLQSINVVEGRPAPSAELKRALILKAGHAFNVHEMTGTRVRVSGLRAGLPESDRLTVEWTIDMARAAGLATKQNWRNYPRAMLMARATDDLARAMFPDVVKGLGDADVVLHADPATGEILEPLEVEPPARKAIQRTRRPRTPAVAPVAEEEAETPPPATGEDTRPPVAPPSTEEAIERPAPAPEAHTGTTPSSGTTPETPPPRAAAYDDDAVAPPYPKAHQPDDVPLPPEMRPHGTGQTVRPDVATEPEQPVEEPPVPGQVPRITASPLKAVNAALTRELGTAATPEERHSMLSAITGRTITTSKDLTRAEGYSVLSFLARVASGNARYDMDPETGHIDVHDAALEPPEDQEA